MILIFLITLGYTDQNPLGLADLPAFQQALADLDGEAVDVDFRAIWEHPERFEKTKVRVRGTIQRRFRQPSVGEFPPLVETWILDPGKNLICLVQPDDPGLPTAGQVEFTGRFLRIIRYKAGDADRLAPLVVGSGPLMLKQAETDPSSDFMQTRLEYIFAAFVGFICLMMITRRMTDKPLPRKLRNADDPPPDFVS